MGRRTGLLVLLLALLAACGPSTTPTDAPAPPAATVEQTPVPVTPTLPPPQAPTYTDATPPATAALGETWLRPTDGMRMVYVPAGSFEMGSDPSDPRARDDEMPRHTVTVSGFWIDQLEVTHAQFVDYLNTHGNTREGGGIAVRLGAGYCRIEQDGDTFSVRESGAQLPVMMVTWYGAQSYCEWVGGRLPTEAEWEYAARGPDGNPFPWGDEAASCALANYGDCGRAPQAVGMLPAGASWCGALDMAGNVWEWVADGFGRYPDTPQENPLRQLSDNLAVMRGGGWHSPWWEVRSTYRAHDTAASSYNG